MSKRDFYDLLGVARDASDADIKKAFRKLAMQFHPDRNKDDKDAEQRFKEINEAYDVLKDKEKRAAYDRFGHAAFEQGMGGGPGGGPGGFGFDFGSGGGGGFSDIFDDLFGDAFGGGRRRRNGPQRGSDLRFDYEVTLDDAYHGKVAEITVPTAVRCGGCEGSGAKPGSAPVTCDTCNGQGSVRSQRGFFTMEQTCPTCHGAGQRISDPCGECHGTGRQQKKVSLSVNVPPGVEDGTRIRLAGKGEAGARGGPAGDLYLFISVKPHKLFERDGAHLLARVPVAMTTAALGGEIELPTLDGKKVRLDIPAGTQTGKQFRLRGKGMPVLQRSSFGDLLVRVVVETPVNLSAKQKQLLKDFEAQGSKNSPEADRFQNRVKQD